MSISAVLPRSITAIGTNAIKNPATGATADRSAAERARSDQSSPAITQASKSENANNAVDVFTPTNDAVRVSAAVGNSLASNGTGPNPVKNRDRGSSTHQETDSRVPTNKPAPDPSRAIENGESVDGVNLQLRTPPTNDATRKQIDGVSPRERNDSEESKVTRERSTDDSPPIGGATENEGRSLNVLR